MALADGILPNATWVQNPRSAGIPYVIEPTTKWKIVLHEIQGDDRLDMIRTHPSPPQLWYDPVTRELSQTINLRQSGYALYHYAGRRETNRALAVQVELAGFSSPLPDEPLQVLDNIAEDVIVPICQFVAAMGGQIDLTKVPPQFVYSGSASEHAAQRFSDDAYQAWPGIIDHSRVPQNEHWDVGAMNMKRIAEHAAWIIGGMLQPVTPGGKDMADVLFNRRPVPFDDAGIWGPNDVAFDHPRLPVGATIVVSSKRPDHSGFFSVLYGPGFQRDAYADVVRVVHWGAPVTYTTRAVGQHSIIIPEGIDADVRAIY